MAFSKDLGLYGGLGREGFPQLSEATRPPSTIHRLFLYIMYKVEGAGLWPWRRGIGTRGEGNRY